ncbi:META domain-containing protein [Hymenobacter sp. GOD-10R]|uniref:META domain-containing protein n=1 Tax=Hymenobacter sp. GOD-10R TaxID=3093922 RepID=UPI002D79AE25|nr:META domain-containing protein [Hymenobacter sp. GOD-10R]WRQ29734.1 META domain-containing protein [Hymenobacter sp. GOD-10R]
MRRHFSSCLAGVALLAVSCQEDSDLAPGRTLLNTRWKLAYVGDFPLMASSYSYDTDSYIEFRANNLVNGLATCTTFNGKFAYTPATQQMSVAPLTLGTPTCSSPTVAARYLAALPTIVRYEVADGSLRLYDGQSPKPQLVFQPE